MREPSSRRTRAGRSCPCVTGPTQEPLLKEAGERTTTGVAATLAYGPGGIEVWAGKKSDVKVFAYPWSKVTDVSTAADIRTWQKRTVIGVRITLAKDATQDIAVLVKTPQVAVLTESIRAARPV